MRSIKFLILFFVFIFSSSFFFFKSRDYADMAREIRAKVGRNLAKKHNMDFIGVGGGMMDNVNMIGLSFQIHHAIDRKEAREIIVSCVENLLLAINENEEIRPFLKNYPFTTENIRIEIYVNRNNGQEVFDPDFRVVSINECDDIIFYTVDKSNKYKYKNRIREPYQEALATVKNSKN